MKVLISIFFVATKRILIGFFFKSNFFVTSKTLINELNMERFNVVMSMSLQGDFGGT
jgi:hypothetical protein